MEIASPTLILISNACRRFGISACRFGIEAVNEPNLVYGLRRGRTPRPRTTEAILAYIATLGPWTEPNRAPVKRAMSSRRAATRTIKLPQELTFAEHCVMMREGSAKLLSAILSAKGVC